MAFSQGSRTSLSYVPEVTFGTTPATPQLVQIPFNTHSINLTKELIESSAITPDRMIRNSRHGNRQVSGEIAVELSPRDFDSFLEAAFFNTWTSNVLKIGQTLKTFSIEDGAQDVGQYRLFTGCAVSSMSCSIAPNQMAQTTFNWVGKDMSISTTSVDPTKTAPYALPPFDSCSGQIKVGNAGGTASVVATISSIEFTIDNATAATFVVGQCSTPQLEFGMATVSGTISAYFENLDFYNRFLNETETRVEFELDTPDGLNTYTFVFPRVKFNTGDLPVSGPASRVMTINFSAIYDSTTNTLVQVTRPAYP